MWPKCEISCNVTFQGCIVYFCPLLLVCLCAQETHLFPHVELPGDIGVSVIFITGPAVELSLNNLLLYWQLSRDWNHTHTHTSMHTHTFAIQETLGLLRQASFSKIDARTLTHTHTHRQTHTRRWSLMGFKVRAKWQTFIYFLSWTWFALMCLKMWWLCVFLCCGEKSGQSKRMGCVCLTMYFGIPCLSVYICTQCNRSGPY